MSIFTVIGLAIVSYFIVGGLIAGLLGEGIDFTAITFWPALVIAFVVDAVSDAYEVALEMYYTWRYRE